MGKIILTVDHKWRDLPNNVYLKLLLEKHFGHKVVLSRLGETEAIVHSFKPDLVVYNNLYDEKKNRFAKTLSDNGVKIVILPTEGITFSSDQTLLFSHKYSGISFIDQYYAWNKLIYDAIVDNDVLPPEKLCCIGSSRFDFYKRPLNNLLKGKAYFANKYEMPPENKNILFVSNFANAEHWNNTSFIEKDLASQRANKINSFKDPKRLAEYEYVYRERFFKSLEAVVAKAENINIVVKYHPSEKVKTYLDLAKRLRQISNNVFLMHGEYIWDVLNVSDLVIQRCSTVAVEAWLLGKVTIEMEYFDPHEHFLKPCYEAGSYIAKDENELVEKVLELIDLGKLPQDIDMHRQTIMGRVAGPFDGGATMRIAASFDELLQRPVPPDYSVIRPLGAKEFLKSISRKYLGFSGYGIAKKIITMGFRDYLGRYDKVFSVSDQRAWEKRIEEIL